MKSRLPALLAYALIAALGLAFALQSRSLGYWVDGVAGAGLLPLFAATPLVLLVGLVVFSERRATAGSADQLAPPFIAIVALALFAFSLPWAGFALGTLALVVVWSMALYRKHWFKAALLALLSVAAAALIFQFVLGVPIPLKPAGL